MLTKISPFIIVSILSAQNLNNIINTAVKNNFKLKSYNHSIKAKDYEIKKAKDAYLPSITLYTSLKRERYKEEYSYKTVNIHDRSSTYGINIKQNIFNYQILTSIKDAKLRKKVTTLEKEAFLLNLYQQVLTTYFEIITNKEKLKLFSKRKDNYKEILDNVLAKNNYKYATNVDVAEAKSNYSIAYNDYIKAKLAYKNSIRKLQLLLLTNKPININKNIKDNIDKIISSILLPYEKYKAKLQNNPSIKKSLLYVKIAKNQITSTKSNLYPNINLSASYSNTNAKETVPEKHHFQISLNLNLNLFDKSAYDSISQSKELYLAALNDYEYQKNALEIDFNKNWDNLKSAIEIIKSDKEKILQTQEYLNLAKESYKYKLISLTDYYTAQNNYFQALITLQNDKLNLLYYYINLLAQTNELKEKVNKFNLFIN